MPKLKLRHENFCRHFVLDPNASRAAIVAGYARSGARQTGSRLAQRSDVAGRIAELRAEMAERHALDRDTLVAKLEAVFRAAFDDHHFYAAARAVELQARLAGHLTDPRTAGARRARDAADSALPAAGPPASNGRDDEGTAEEKSGAP